MQPYKTIEITREEIVPLAKRMREKGVTLAMIHGFVEKAGGYRVDYEYELGGGIESYQVKTGEGTLPSISAIYDTAAAWPEKELQELMGISFEGLDMKGRLFLPENRLSEEGQILVTPLHELRKKNEGAELESKA